MAKYTVEPGRQICRDGKFFLELRRHGGDDPSSLSPVQADALTRWLCKQLNSWNFDLDAIVKAHLEAE